MGTGMPYLEVKLPRGRKRIELGEKAVTIGRHADERIRLWQELIERLSRLGAIAKCQTVFAQRRVGQLSQFSLASVDLPQKPPAT